MNYPKARFYLVVAMLQSHNSINEYSDTVVYGITANKVKPMKTPLFSNLTNKESSCKFKETCGLYTIKSYTCTHTGGSYCGRYRKLSKDPTHDNEGLMEVAQ